MEESAGCLISFGRTPYEDMTNLLSHKGTESFQERLFLFSAQECFFYVKTVAITVTLFSPCLRYLLIYGRHC